jgi:hypothetical protein
MYKLFLLYTQHKEYTNSDHEVYVKVTELEVDDTPPRRNSSQFAVQGLSGVCVNAAAACCNDKYVL